MTVPAIGAVGAALPTMPTAALGGATGSPDVSSSGSIGGDFASALTNGINAVQDTQQTADNLAIKAATGDLDDVHDYTIAATQAQLVTELATAIRTKGVDAFNQIMGMQA